MLTLVPVMVPKELALLALVLGVAHTGWLAALNISHRNSRRCFSVVLKSLWSEKSNVTTPGPTTEFRPTLPYVPEAGTENAARVNQLVGTGLSRCGLMPVALGRSKPPPVPERSVPPMFGVIGKPLCSVTIEPICQSPTIGLTNLLVTLTRLPLPIGRAHSPEATKRWRASQTGGPYSHLTA